MNQKHIPAPEVISDFRCMQCDKSAVDDKNGARCEEHMIKNMWGSWLDKAAKDVEYEPSPFLIQIDSLASMMPHQHGHDSNAMKLSELAALYNGRQLGKSNFQLQWQLDMLKRKEFPSPPTSGTPEYRTHIST